MRQDEAREKVMRGFLEWVATFVSEPSFLHKYSWQVTKLHYKRIVFTVFYSTWRQKLNYVCWSIKDMEKLLRLPMAFDVWRALAVAFCEKWTTKISINSHFELIWIYSKDRNVHEMKGQSLYSEAECFISGSFQRLHIKLALVFQSWLSIQRKRIK